MSRSITVAAPRVYVFAAPGRPSTAVKGASILADVARSGAVFGADGEHIAVQAPSPVAGSVSVEGPIFVVRAREAGVPANLLAPEIRIGDRSRRSAYRLIQYKHRQNHWDYTHCSTPFLRLEMQAPEF
jgi:hypothetical protein